MERVHIHLVWDRGIHIHPGMASKALMFGQCSVALHQPLGQIVYFGVELSDPCLVRSRNIGSKTHKVGGSPYSHAHPYRETSQFHP